MSHDIVSIFAGSGGNAGESKVVRTKGASQGHHIHARHLQASPPRVREQEERRIEENRFLFGRGVVGTVEKCVHEADKMATMKVPKKSTGTFICLTNPSATSWESVPEALPIGAWMRSDNPKRKMVGIEGKTTSLAAKNYGKAPAEKADRKLEKYFVFAAMGDEIVMLNKSDAEGAFVLKETIKESAVEAGALSFVAPPLVEASSRRERHAQLEENFGSRKRRKTQQKQSMAMISSDRVVGSDKLESALETLLNPDEDAADAGESSASHNLRKLLPPFDEKAELPEDAYPMAGYFPSEDRQSVLKSCSEEDFSWESSFARSRFIRTKNQDARKLAGYFECLLRFRNKIGAFVGGPSDVVRLMGFGDISLGQSLLKRFMEAQPANMGGGWGKTRILKDKLVINMLIVALACDGYRLTPQVVQGIAADLKVETASLTPLLFKIGCKTSSEHEEKFYELKVPLKFVEERRRGRRGGRN